MKILTDNIIDSTMQNQYRKFYSKPEIGGEVCLRTDSDILSESTAGSSTVETGGQDEVDIDLENGGFDATWEP